MGGKDIVNANVISSDTLAVGGADPNFTVDSLGNVTADGTVYSTGLAVGGADPNFTVDDSGNVVADGNISAADVTCARLFVGGADPNVVIDADGNITADGAVVSDTLAVSGMTVDTDGNVVVVGSTTFGTVGNPTTVTVHKVPTAGTDVVNKAYVDGKTSPGSLIGHGMILSGIRSLKAGCTDTTATWNGVWPALAVTSAGIATVTFSIGVTDCNASVGTYVILKNAVPICTGYIQANALPETISMSVLTSLAANDTLAYAWTGVDGYVTGPRMVFTQFSNLA
jgi:hypothetical protein